MDRGADVDDAAYARLDTLGARFAATYSVAEGYFKNHAVPAPGTGALAPTHERDLRPENYAFRGTLLWEPTDTFTARLKANHVYDHATNADQNYPEFFKDAAATNKKLKLLWVGVGKDDKLVMTGSLALRDALTKGGIKHTFRETEGRHEWVVWRHHLREVAPLLFR